MAEFDNVNFSVLGETDGVRDWQGLQILATFDNNNNQANISTSELSFVGEMGKAIIAQSSEATRHETIAFGTRLNFGSWNPSMVPPILYDAITEFT